MDLSLALEKEAHYLSEMGSSEGRINQFQVDLALATDTEVGEKGKGGAKKAAILQQLGAEQAKHGLYKNFYEFWHRTIQECITVVSKMADAAFPRG